MYITFIYIHVDHCLNVQKMMVLLSIAFSVQVLTREVSTYKTIVKKMHSFRSIKRKVVSLKKKERILVCLYNNCEEFHFFTHIHLSQNNIHEYVH